MHIPLIPDLSVFLIDTAVSEKHIYRSFIKHMILLTSSNPKALWSALSMLRNLLIFTNPELQISR